LSYAPIAYRMTTADAEGIRESWYAQPLVISTLSAFQEHFGMGFRSPLMAGNALARVVPELYPAISVREEGIDAVREPRTVDDLDPIGFEERVDLGCEIGVLWTDEYWFTQRGGFEGV